MRPLVATLCVFALAALGCGGKSDREEYVEKYRPLNDRLIEVSQQISGTLGSGEPIGNKLNIQIAQLETINRNIEALDEPEELRDEAMELTGRVGDSVATLRRIASAVHDGKQKEATAATVRLATQAQAVNTARDRLNRAAGID
jgi:hypothetical protein